MKEKQTKINRFTLIMCVLFLLSMLCGFTSTFDTATPQGSDDPAEADDRMREIKLATQERMNVCGYWPLTGTEVSDADAGEFRKILFHAPLTSPATVAANHGYIGIKDFSAKAELIWIDEDENEIQLTDAGSINLASGDLLGVLANDTYFTAVDNAGTGTVDLIKANTSDLATLSDGSVLAAATETGDGDRTIADKAYVHLGAWTPNTAYAGEESVTFPNGLIQKRGTVVVAANNSTAVSFGTAFPGGIINIQLSFQGSGIAAIAGVWASKSISVSGFTLENGMDLQRTFYWFAEGH